jgi:hypothetical protein
MLALALTAPVVRAQPVTAPSPIAPLADFRDEKQLAQALAMITQDPAVPVADPKLRALAAALMLEGVRQLQAHAYEQALANFLEAYDKLPSPKILLDIGSMLRAMGRLADAANTYQRYLADPATGPEHVEEVKTLLLELDKQLTLLTVHVQPKGSELSIDGGPFIAVGSSLVARVRPGIHLVRVRNAAATGEVTVNAFEGEIKDITATVPGPDAKPPEAKPDDTRPLPTVRTDEPPDRHFGWLDTSTQYGTRDPSSTQRQVHTGFSGPPVAAIVPRMQDEEIEEILTPPPRDDVHRISPGVIGLMRIDGKLRGAAGGIGVAVSALESVEVELAVLRSNQWGMYGGMRLRLLTGYLRPYLAGGLPGFVFEDENDGMKTKVAMGLRGAAGLEVRINAHLSVQADLGLELFFIDPGALVDGKHPDTTVFVPALGVIGRL